MRRFANTSKANILLDGWVCKSNLEETIKNYDGFYTFIIFSHTSNLKQKPEHIGEKLGEYLKVKEDLAVKIIEIVEKNSAGFAFPSQSIYLESLPSDKPEIFNPTKSQ